MRGAGAVVHTVLATAAVVGGAVVDCRARRARRSIASVACAVRGAWAVVHTLLATAAVVRGAVVDCRARRARRCIAVIT